MKRIIIFLLILTIPFVLIAEDKIYEAEIINHFEQASSEEEGLFYEDTKTSRGSYFICCFNSDDDILILDTNKGFFYNLDLFEGITEAHKIEETVAIIATRMDISENGIELFSRYIPNYYQFSSDYILRVYCMLNYLNGNFGVNYDTESRAVCYENETVFFWMDNGEFLSIQNPGIDFRENNRNILGTADTRELFNSGTEYSLQGLSIVGDGNYLLRNNNLVTNHYYQYIKYYEYLNPSYAALSGHGYSIFSETSPFYYLGSDLDGNRYYSDLTNYLIFDIDGYCFESFKVIREGGMSIPFLDEVGNIYFLELHHQYEGDVGVGPADTSVEIVGVDYYIKKITRTWGLPEQAQTLGE